MRSVTRLAIWSMPLALFAACSSTPVAPPAGAPAPKVSSAPMPATAPAAPATAVAPPTASSTIKSVTLPPYLDPQNSLSKDRSVFFEFDDFSIQPAYQELIARHGGFLASHPDVAIKVEGNCDERGSAEYNLALGQKRAQTVVNALKIVGVKDSQMEAISWGEERPRAAGHDEQAWAQNRRADLDYPTR